MTAGLAVREAKSRWARKVSDAVADIGEIPEIADSERRAASQLDLHRFLTTYFPASTGLKPFSDDHLRVIERIQRCILEGGLFANVVPRGFAKTTISENASIWAVLYGHRRFVPIFSADAAAAESNIDSIKLELSENELLYADFPEVIHAIRALEGKPQRCLSQTYKGAQTHIEWRADTIVLPTIPDSAASGAILTAQGLTGASRGMKHKRPDGTQQRPDFVIMDDPQTDESAGTALQVKKRLDVIRKSILKLGGHDRRIAAVMNATVIRPDDLIEQILDPRKFPAWQGERVKMVKRWADQHDTLWLGDYARLRNTFDPDSLGDQQRAHGAATEFYRANREKMDAGCTVSWQHCFAEATELSAIQHAYNQLIDDGEEVFASECQNEPLVEKVDDDELALKPDFIARKTCGMERGALPIEASRVVGFIDPKKDLLYWCVVAFGEGFGGWVVDYGTFPDQRKVYFSSRKPRHTLARVMKAASWEAALYAGLDALVNLLTAREWHRDDGANLKLERLAIDANWGDATETIYQFCRQSPQAAVLLPSHGKFYGASSRPFNDYQHKPGDRSGLMWRMPAVGNRRAVRYEMHDTNWWKTFTANRLKTPAGARGCLSLFNAPDPDTHKLFADHAVSERPIVVEAKGRRVVEWKQQIGVDNDWWDCLVGCHVAASIQGVSLHEQKQIARQVLSLADMKKNAKHWDATAKKWVTRAKQVNNAR